MSNVWEKSVWYNMVLSDLMDRCSLLLVNKKNVSKTQSVFTIIIIQAPFINYHVTHFHSLATKLEIKSFQKLCWKIICTWGRVTHKKKGPKGETGNIITLEILDKQRRRQKLRLASSSLDIWEMTDFTKKEPIQQIQTKKMLSLFISVAIYHVIIQWQQTLFLPQVNIKDSFTFALSIQPF